MQSGQNDERERFIDENLRRVYDETMEEGIPDKFKDLLNQLKEQDKNAGKKGCAILIPATNWWSICPPCAALPSA